MNDMTIERVLNSHWWATALVQRRALDSAAHAEGRGHQSVDPDGKEPHWDDHELTSWEAAWIQARISDAHYEKARAGDEGVGVLAEPLEEHEARELHARALDYFGATHDATRAKFEVKRAEHQKAHDGAHLLKHRPDPDGKFEPIPADAVAAIREQHVQSMAQIDDYLKPSSGLIDRHIATVRAEVAEKRRIAQAHVADAELILSVPFPEHVARWHREVRDAIRAQAPARPVVEAPEEVETEPDATVEGPAVDVEVSPLLERAMLRRALEKRAAARVAPVAAAEPLSPVQQMCAEMLAHEDHAYAAGCARREADDAREDGRPDDGAMLDATAARIEAELPQVAQAPAVESYDESAFSTDAEDE